MQELHQYIFLMQYFHLLIIILHKFKKSFFFEKYYKKQKALQLNAKGLNLQMTPF